MKPKDFHVSPNGIGMAYELVDSLHKAELEFAATLIIYYHHCLKYEDWVPTSRRELSDFCKDNEIALKWFKNPFWLPDPQGLVIEGYVEGWTEDPDAKGVFTPKFFEAVKSSRERRR